MFQETWGVFQKVCSGQGNKKRYRYFGFVKDGTVFPILSCLEAFGWLWQIIELFLEGVVETGRLDVSSFHFVERYFGKDAFVYKGLDVFLGRGRADAEFDLHIFDR